MVNDTLRVYLPLGTTDSGELSSEELSSEALVVISHYSSFSYPGVVDGWEQVSVAFAAQGYGRGGAFAGGELGHSCRRARNGCTHHFELARTGHTRALLHRRSPRWRWAVVSAAASSTACCVTWIKDDISAWVTIGGIGDAFSGAHDFYTGAITVPAAYELVIPAMGNPKIHPMPFLRLSPTYIAGQLPPTLIIHTDADTIIPISQAEDLASALRAAGVPVETFYYTDVSHYLQIEDNMTDEARTMFYHILDFVEQYQEEPNMSESVISPTAEISEEAYRALRDGAVLQRRPTSGLLVLSDADRQDFLHRMTTNEINGLKVGQSTVTILTSPTARTEYVFTVVCRSDELWLLPAAGETDVLGTQSEGQDLLHGCRESRGRQFGVGEDAANGSPCRRGPRDDWH